MVRLFLFVNQEFYINTIATFADTSIESKTMVEEPKEEGATRNVGVDDRVGDVIGVESSKVDEMRNTEVDQVHVTGMV